MQPPTVRCGLTVLFEDPFWVGVWERTDDAGYAVARQVFGGEPSDGKLYAFVLEYFSILKFSQPIEEAIVQPHAVNFKRALRQAKHSTAERGIGTKAQQALQAEFESEKQIRKEISKQERDAEKERQFLLRQQKKKEKQRGH